MIVKYDKKELEYLSYKLNQLIKDSQNEYIDKESNRIFVVKKDLEAINKNSLYLSLINEFIPNVEINIMADLIERIKECGGTKYSRYRACENYLYKTAWFMSLSKDNQYYISFDFYRIIILEINNCLKRRDNYIKESQSTN